VKFSNDALPPTAGALTALFTARTDFMLKSFGGGPNVPHLSSGCWSGAPSSLPNATKEFVAGSNARLTEVSAKLTGSGGGGDVDLSNVQPSVEKAI
jgi:hypothetical protein